ncbi:trace amine-associated receptor 4-like [Dreissena polymorpha]|nr:trace amine-associated receptor 4-like [Dreissena polymorpha]
METDEEILARLNHEEAKQYVGGVVFVALLMTAGIFGNLHVLYVYVFRMQSSNYRVFVLSLATLDFITCVVGMPFILVDLRNPLTFTLVAACKILRFVNYFICLASAFLLIVIAVDRYRKICVPFGKQMSRMVAKVSCLVVIGFSLLLSWPAPVLYGQDIVMTSHENITGTRCYEENKYRGTQYMAYFNELLILVFFVAFVVLVVLYSLSWRVIRKQSLKRAEREGHRKTATKMSNVTSSVDHPAAQSVDSDDATNKQCDKNVKNEQPTISQSELSRRGDAEKNNHDHAKRTTVIFALITAVFVLSYFPQLSLKIITFLNPNFVPNMSFTGRVLYNTFIWCFFINNMANAYINGFLDRRFRAEIRLLYGHLMFCRRT